jgi:hypothetical protein
LVARLRQRFELQVHPRSIERALLRRKKASVRSPPAIGDGGLGAVKACEALRRHVLASIALATQQEVCV